MDKKMKELLRNIIFDNLTLFSECEDTVLTDSFSKNDILSYSYTGSNIFDGLVIIKSLINIFFNKPDIVSQIVKYIIDLALNKEQYDLYNYIYSEYLSISENKFSINKYVIYDKINNKHIIYLL